MLHSWLRICEKDLLFMVGLCKIHDQGMIYSGASTMILGETCIYIYKYM